jgi:mannose-1-phosphate guanylyltransferase
MIRRIIGWLAASGVSDLVLNLHHLPETLTAVVGDGSDLGVRVRYSWEQPRVLGSAGGPRQALPLVEGDALLIVNGDTLTDLRLGDLADAHAASGALVTLALVPNREYERYGGVVLDGEQRVTGFVGRGPSAKGSFHFIGVQIANRSVFEPLPLGEPINSIGQVYNTLIARDRNAVRGAVIDAEFWDVGTVDDYWRTSRAFAEKERRGDVSVGRAGTIHPTARIARSILWDDVEVGANAVIEDCIITDRVHVAAGVIRRNAILVADGS